MAELAQSLLRTVARAFYTTEHILVIDTLILHSTLSDTDLAFVLGMNPKSLRKLCGRLREDGLVTVQSRAERKTDGTQSFYHGSSSQLGKERVTHKDWYYLNFHRAIDSIKYRMYKLNKHVESLGASTTEKKDLICPRCKSQYTELEVMDKMDYSTGRFHCRRCGSALDPVEEDEKGNENETMKRLNSQMEKVLRLMREIDATTVPENDFQTALSNQKEVVRTDANPGQKGTESFDLPENVQSSKGLEIKPEKISVSVQEDVDVRKEGEISEAAARREKEARQNALPDWIAKSTVSGDITAVGVKAEQLRREREATTTTTKDDGTEEKKLAKDGDEDVMASYWEELAKAQAQEAAARAQRSEDDDEDDDDDDEFEDVDVTGTGSANGTPAKNGVGVNGSATPSGMNTPNLESSNATDDEREVKRVRIEEPMVAGQSSKQTKGGNDGTPAASDEDDDDLEFENV